MGGRSAAVRSFLGRLGGNLDRDDEVLGQGRLVAALRNRARRRIQGHGCYSPHAYI